MTLAFIAVVAAVNLSLRRFNVIITTGPTLIASVTVSSLVVIAFLYLMFSDVVDRFSMINAFLSGEYYKYKGQEWPLVSSIATTPPTLNIAFPDKSIIYYIASFKGEDPVMLEGTFPPNIYFWSITIYDTTGAPVSSVSDTTFRSAGSYTIAIGPGFSNATESDGVYRIKCPTGLYCAIMRVYKSVNTPPILPYLPHISGVETTPVDDEARVKGSLSIQKMFQTLFTKKSEGKTPEQMFPGINPYAFFLPSQGQVDLAFPNPFAQYLMVFPKSASSMIQVTGKLQSNIGWNNNDGLRFVSFMAANMLTTATDDSVNFEELGGSGTYTIFVTKNPLDAKQAAMQQGLRNYKVIRWDATNDFPVLIYRIVVVGSRPMTLNNSTASVDGTSVASALGEYYPVVTHL